MHWRKAQRLFGAIKSILILRYRGNMEHSNAEIWGTKMTLSPQKNTTPNPNSTDRQNGWHPLGCSSMQEDLPQSGQAFWPILIFRFHPGLDTALVVGISRLILYFAVKHGCGLPQRMGRLLVLLDSADHYREA